MHLYRKSLESRYGSLEGFEQQDYIKLAETYVEPEGTNLDLLYANYYGEESSPPQETWQNKTLEQCVDLCNQLEGCHGFTRRANVADTAADECQPRTKIGICHSVRKGDPAQMQNAIKYNSYIKAKTSNGDSKILTKCIGDPVMTLQRAVYIKSQMFPNKYIGTLGDGLAILVDKTTSDFDIKCKFRVEVGKDGIGTVSFLHINSNKYLYRMPASVSTTTTAPMTTAPMTTAPMTTAPVPTTITELFQNQMQSQTVDESYEFMGLKDITSGGTEDKQRASFNILDAAKNQMKFLCMRVSGENTDKFIVINNENRNYLLCSEIDNLPSEGLYTFSIVDSIIVSNIITNKDKLNSPKTTTTMPVNTMPVNTMATDMPSTTMQSASEESMGMDMGMGMGMGMGMSPRTGKESFFAVDAIGNQITSKSASSGALNASDLDTSNQLPLYNNLYTPPSVVKISDYLNDNYGVSQFNKYTSIDKKASDIILQKQLSQSLNKNQETYNALNQLNLEIEREIAGLNMDLNGKNDKVANNIGRMQLADMAKDYYTLKRAYPMAVE